MPGEVPQSDKMITNLADKVAELESALTAERQKREEAERHVEQLAGDVRAACEDYANEKAALQRMREALEGLAARLIETLPDMAQPPARSFMAGWSRCTVCGMATKPNMPIEHLPDCALHAALRAALGAEPGNGCGKKHFGCHCPLCRAALEQGNAPPAQPHGGAEGPKAVAASPEGDAGAAAPGDGCENCGTRMEFHWTERLICPGLRRTTMWRPVGAASPEGEGSDG